MVTVEAQLVEKSNASPILLAELHQLRLRLAEAYATIAALRADQTDLEGDLRQLRRAASTDALTGLWNRRFFLDSLDVSSAFAIRHALPLSLVLVDVDHFKALNDLYGHAAGDAVLRDIAAEVHACARGHDVVARYGGEEFAILLPGTDGDGAIAMADRVRGRLEARTWPVRSVTASFGAATLGRRGREVDPHSGSPLIEAADMALYHSKRRGRNRVTHADALLRPAEPKDRRTPDESAARD